MLLTVREIVKAIVPDVGHISTMTAFLRQCGDADTQMHQQPAGNIKRFLLLHDHFGQLSRLLHSQLVLTPSNVALFIPQTSHAGQRTS